MQFKIDEKRSPKMHTDPFSCFDSDDEDNHDELPAERMNLDDHVDRDENCGVLAFHHNTEQSLLMHVKNQIKNCNNDKIPRHIQVLNHIDSFCRTRHWMMCVGPEKGKIISDSLEKVLNNKIKMHHSIQDRIPFICVELGTYCGYGSVLLAGIFKDNPMLFNYFDFHLFTVEINPEFAKVALEMIKLAEVDDVIKIVENHFYLDGSTGHVGEILYDEIKTVLSSPRIDFLLIDHDKDSYLSDLKRIETCNLLQKGSTVVADNVIFAGINDYINYMREKESARSVSTVTHVAHVEYSSFTDEYIDGVGKLIHYNLTKFVMTILILTSFFFK
jgi:catechol O-methyltransferase